MGVKNALAYNTAVLIIHMEGLWQCLQEKYVNSYLS
jgi:hypothetical protein